MAVAEGVGDGVPGPAGVGGGVAVPAGDGDGVAERDGLGTGVPPGETDDGVAAGVTGSPSANDGGNVPGATVDTELSGGAWVLVAPGAGVADGVPEGFAAAAGCCVGEAGGVDVCVGASTRVPVPVSSRGTRFATRLPAKCATAERASSGPSPTATEAELATDTVRMAPAASRATRGRGRGDAGVQAMSHATNRGRRRSSSRRAKSARMRTVAAPEGPGTWSDLVRRTTRSSRASSPSDGPAEACPSRASLRSSGEIVTSDRNAFPRRLPLRPRADVGESHDHTEDDEETGSQVGPQEPWLA